MLAAGTLAAIVRQDANWDLKNYHFYNAWAFVHQRMEIDVAPAQLQTYLNPLLDLPFYAMVAAGWPPRAIAFAMGLFAGAGAFFLVKVAADPVWRPAAARAPQLRRVRRGARLARRQSRGAARIDDERMARARR